jgi:DNA-binding response OmpR family regulator
MHNVVLVEDSEEYQLIVSRSLANAGIALHIASSYREVAKVLSHLGHSKIDLAILDLVLPDGDGFQVLEDLRHAGMNRETPVFFLSSQAELDSKVTAFNLGADDYIVKPINPVELRARVEMRLKKSKSVVADVVVRGELTIELSLLKGSRLVDGVPKDMQLTAKEFKILAFLVQNENKVFSRANVVEAVWGNGLHVLDRTVDSHIYGLRKKMGPIAHYIDCIPGAGYRFISPSLNSAVS